MESRRGDIEFESVGVEVLRIETDGQRAGDELHAKHVKSGREIIEVSRGDIGSREDDTPRKQRPMECSLAGIEPKSGDGTEGIHAKAQRRKALCSDAPSPDGRIACFRQVPLLCVFAPLRDIPFLCLGLSARDAGRCAEACGSVVGKPPFLGLPHEGYPFAKRSITGFPSPSFVT